MKALKSGLIGSHIQATRLPRALALMCEDAGIELDFQLIDTGDRPDFDFTATVRDLIARGWTGVTVTHPYKTDAAAFAGDAMPPPIRPLGASNTLVFGPPLTAHNTDYTGFLGAWRAQMGDASPGAVAMAGSGGVGRALGFALRDLGATDIVLWDVLPERAAALATAIGAPARAIPAATATRACRAADGLVNATAIGMTYAPGMAFAPDAIGGQAWAFDAVYTPTNTAFLTAARDAGLRTISGFDLFRHMAIGSFTAYTGIVPDPGAVLTRLAALAPDT